MSNFKQSERGTRIENHEGTKKVINLNRHFQLGLSVNISKIFQKQ